jgi:hypothetical protein
MEEIQKEVVKLDYAISFQDVLSMQENVLSLGVVATSSLYSHIGLAINCTGNSSSVSLQLQQPGRLEHGLTLYKKYCYFRFSKVIFLFYVKIRLDVTFRQWCFEDLWKGNGHPVGPITS